MEIVMIGLIIAGGAIILGVLFDKALKHRAEKKAEKAAIEEALALHRAQRAARDFSRTGVGTIPRGTRFTPQAAQPTPVASDPSNALLYGAIGYALGSNASHHSDSSRSAEQFDGSGGLSGGGGASSSWDDSSSRSSDSGSSSSDSSSSYSSSDSGSSSSSSDSGSSSSGSSD